VFAANVFGGGVKFQPLQDGKPTSPSRNVVRGGQVGGDEACIELLDARDNRLEEIDFAGCQSVVARAVDTAHNTLVGVDVARLRLNLLGGAILNLGTPVRVEVRGRGGKPVAGAHIELRDATGHPHEGPVTDKSGAARCIVPTHVVNALGLSELTPVTVNVRANGQGEGRVVLDDPPPAKVIVTLK
jgi:hypothetical protein